jgi:hypothetical protein
MKTIREESMHRIMIKCARTGRAVSTGIETDPATFALIPQVAARTHCPCCGADHVWSKANAWICDRPARHEPGRPASPINRPI